MFIIQHLHALKRRNLLLKRLGIFWPGGRFDTPIEAYYRHPLAGEQPALRSLEIVVSSW